MQSAIGARQQRNATSHPRNSSVSQSDWSFAYSTGMFSYKNTLAMRATKIIKNNDGCIFKTIHVNLIVNFRQFKDISGS